jgi:hypothetical protein
MAGNQSPGLACPTCDRLFETEDEASDHARECVPPLPLSATGPGEIHDPPEVEERELKTAR